MPATILYVDDDSELERLIRSTFHKQNAGELAGEFAHSEAAALTQLNERSEPYHAIVIDISMSGMSDLGLLDAMAERQPETPIVILAAPADLPRVRQAMNHGAFDFLLEPLDLHDLELTLAKALRHYQTVRRAGLVARATNRPELAALGLLVAGVAHDLRNPLGLMTNFTTLARELLEELGQQVEAQCQGSLAASLNAQVESVVLTLGKVAAHGEWALDLVGSLVASGGGGSGPLNFSESIERHVDLFESSVRAVHADHAPAVVIHRQLDPSIGVVALNPRNVLSVVINLLQNAQHALRERVRTDDDFQPEIRVETRALEGAVELSVSDNGPGIPLELREQIFQPFFTTKHPREGAGLGLHIVATTARESGGSVVVEDNSPSGVRFRVRFPR
ncbi:hybrid sensor histidine kinase/response regulator [Enhygromyxa salina]|uniref:histidine kinase n=1 Tax=Enhygromyxa salina TaxID=215803 RepID=A0A2S9YCF6_9BACT|nr:ATP-binding protein [Enhygromyxa salina]PRQ02681.1 C4-dicarboxylate transport sensor protein DctB [Enhygromyxa salina]